MALADPYAPCPCGSDKKYKWCCHRAEGYIERAQRLVESNQLEAAVGVLNEGLAKYPDTPWLLLRKALLLAALRRPKEAKASCAAVLRKEPGHLGASHLMVRMTLMADGPVAAAAEVQSALSHLSPDDRPSLVRAVATVAEHLAKAYVFPAALKHLELAATLASRGGNEGLFDASLNNLKANPMVSPWLKEPYQLSPAPEGLRPEARRQFEQATAWADEGLFGAAASAFELLSGEPSAAPAADRNLGLCRLWLGDDAAAAAALRRYLGRAGATTEAVDLALLCQLVAPADDPEAVEHVQLTWPLRDRNALLKTLRNDASVVEAGTRPSDPDDEDSPEVPVFNWLDRPRIEARAGLALDQIPLVVATIQVGDDHVALETDDDGRMNELMDRFTTLAGQAVPPAHPRTKVLHRHPRSEQALTWHWQLPKDLGEDEEKRLASEQSAHVMNKVWPQTPMEFLGGLTPADAGRGGKHEVALRAELLRLESTVEDWGSRVDWEGLRDRLGISPEPEIDPETADVDHLPLGRLYRLPVGRLDDDRLARLYHRASDYGLHRVLLATAREIVSRPAEGFEGKLDPVGLHTVLAIEAAGSDDREGALGWVSRGRTWGDARRRNELTPHWDMLDIQVRAVTDRPEDWVPELAVVLERYRENERAGMVMTTRLLEMGLLQLDAHPDRPGELLLDSRPLQELLSRYGPKVTTSSGYLGVSATRGEIWTPDSAAKGSSGIWTPGSDAGAAGEKPRIIVTGQ